MALMEESVETETPQHMTALQKANEVRFARTPILRRIRAGESQLVLDVLLFPGETFASLTIYDLLISQRRWGRTRTVQMLTALRIPETKTLGGPGLGSLSERQRDLIADRLGR